MLTQNAVRVLEKRYLAKDEAGKTIETVDGLFRRVAKAVAKADYFYNEGKPFEDTEKDFYEMMERLEFLPNSPTLMNAGRGLGQLSACFVLPVEDSMEGIFDALKYAAIIHKSGGGTGFSFSRLRSVGSAVKTTGGVASGPISFMKVFNSATEAVKQGGTRRGANMGILRIDHPDIIDFIQCKKNNEDITNFNISVGITENFMEAVERDEEYALVDPHTGVQRKLLKAREVFELIVDMAWNNGEPGIIFLDRINRDNIVPEIGAIESTNPCGEQPLLPYESCNLGSINLLSCVKYAAGKSEVDFEKLGSLVDKAVHFLDNVIDVNVYPLPVIEEMTKGTRKIGLGVMGFADMLIRLGIPYNSQAAVDTAEKVMGFISDRSRKASVELAGERGVFPFIDRSIYKNGDMKLRNGTTTTIAPTGTISIIAGVSSGIEPLFAISYIRNVMDNDELPEVNPYFEKVARERGFYSVELMRRIAAHGTLHGIDEIPEDVRRVFVTAHDIEPEWHIRIQAAFQRYTDNAVSKTVNFANNASKEEVKETYRLAYKMGCKGVTIYRDGSRQGQVLNIGSVKRDDEAEKSEKIVPRERPQTTIGITERVKIGCGNLYITVNSDDDGVCEVFTNLGRAGGCPSQSEATSRLISIALRAGVDANEIIEQLKGIRCHSTLRQKGLNVLSCPDAIGRALEKYLKCQSDVHDVMAITNLTEEWEDVLEAENEGCGRNCSLCTNPCKIKERKNFTDNNMKLCPECGSEIQHEGGCVICRNCGYSKCN